MNLKDVFDEILIRSGQFIVASSQVELNIERFRRIVESSLGVYNRFNLYEERILINIPSNIRNFELSDQYIQDITGKKHLKMPVFISDATPSGMGGGLRISPSSGFVSNGLIGMSGLQIGLNGELWDKTQAPFEYRKPYFYPAFSGRWDLLGCFPHTIVEEEIDGKPVFSIPTITYQDQAFFDYLQGMFLLGLGRSRRAFTLNDLPIAMDASDIASEGQAIKDQALEYMSNHQKFYLAF